MAGFGDYGNWPEYQRMSEEVDNAALRARREGRLFLGILAEQSRQQTIADWQVRFDPRFDEPQINLDNTIGVVVSSSSFGGISREKEVSLLDYMKRIIQFILGFPLGQLCYQQAGLAGGNQNQLT